MKIVCSDLEVATFDHAKCSRKIFGQLIENRNLALGSLLCLRTVDFRAPLALPDLRVSLDLALNHGNSLFNKRVVYVNTVF